MRQALVLPQKSKLWAEIKACLFLAVPLATTQLAQQTTSFVDTMMTGLLGAQTLAAGALGAAFFATLLLICTGIVSAVSPMVAEAYGAQKISHVGRIGSQGLWLALGLASLCMVVIWHASYLLRNTGQDATTVTLTESYLRAVVWGFFPALSFAVLRNWVAALSLPRPPMVIMMGGVTFNAIANYVLMFGKLGFPDMGLAGIGWASTIAYWGMFIALIGFISHHATLKTHHLLKHGFQFDPLLFRELLKLGLPIGVLFGVETGLFTVTTFLMGYLGTTVLAAHQIALQTSALAFMIPAGISYATTIRVGQLMGQNNPRGARLAAYVALGIGVTFMAVVAIAFWLMPTAIISVYLDIHDPENYDVIRIAKALFGVAAMFQLVDGAQVIAAGALRGLKDTRLPMLIGIFAYWGIGLTSGYFMGLHLKLGGAGLWGGLALGLAAASVIFIWRFQNLVSSLIPYRNA